MRKKQKPIKVLLSKEEIDKLKNYCIKVSDFELAAKIRMAELGNKTINKPDSQPFLGKPQGQYISLSQIVADWKITIKK